MACIHEIYIYPLTKSIRPPYLSHTPICLGFVAHAKIHSLIQSKLKIWNDRTDISIEVKEPAHRFEVKTAESCAHRTLLLTNPSVSALR